MSKLFAEMHHASTLDQDGEVVSPAHILPFCSDQDMEDFFGSPQDLITGIMFEMVSMKDWYAVVYNGDIIDAKIFPLDFTKGFTDENIPFQCQQYQINCNNRTVYYAVLHEGNSVEIKLTKKPE